MKKFLCLLFAMGIMTFVTACSTGGRAAAAEETISGKAEMDRNDRRTLIAYFSLWGNTDYGDDVEATTSASIVADADGRYGTTGYVANMIQDLTGGDAYLIQTDEKYSSDFEQVVSRNHDETDQGTLPALVNGPINMADYNVVFIGYPIWATDAPQAIYSFLKEYDLTGKTVIPFCTHDGYGAGSSYSTIKELCPGAEVLGGIAIEAKEVPKARDTVKQWMDQLNIGDQLSGGAAPATTVQNGETAIGITIGDQVLNGVLYDNADARQFIAMLPQSISREG